MSTLATAPVDMVKTRLMLQRESKTVGAYKNGLHCVYQVASLFWVFAMHTHSSIWPHFIWSFTCTMPGPPIRRHSGSLQRVSKYLPHLVFTHTLSWVFLSLNWLLVCLKQCICIVHKSWTSNHDHLHTLRAATRTHGAEGLISSYDINTACLSSANLWSLIAAFLIWSLFLSNVVVCNNIVKVSPFPWAMLQP